MLIAMHNLPEHVWISLADLNFPDWTKLRYSSDEKKFQAYGYDLMRQLTNRITTEIHDGNTAALPYAARLVGIYTEDHNRQNEAKDKKIKPGKQPSWDDLVVNERSVFHWLNLLNPCNGCLMVGKMDCVKKTEKRVKQRFMITIGKAWRKVVMECTAFSAGKD